MAKARDFKFVHCVAM